ncbi:hypothetical protein ACFQL4_03930 [Halosimplex aquaticum]
MTESRIRGSPRRGLASATLGFFVGFAGVVVYGPVASEFESAMDLSGLALGLLVGAPQLTGSLLRVPFGAWVDDVGAKQPFLVLLGLSILGMAGLSALLLTAYPEGLTAGLYPLVFLFGALSAAASRRSPSGRPRPPTGTRPRDRGRCWRRTPGWATARRGCSRSCSPSPWRRWGSRPPTSRGSRSSSSGR